VNTVRLLPGDSLFVFDAGGPRVTVFDPVSRRVAHTANLGTAGLVFPYWLQPTANGDALVAAYRAAYGIGPDGRQRGARREVVRLLNGDASVRQDSVLSLPEYEAIPLTLDGNAVGELFDPFGNRTLVASDGRSLFTAWTGGWSIDVHSLDGKTLRTIRPSVPPVPRAITRAEMDSVIHSMASGLIPEPRVRRAMEGVTHRDWPLLQDMLVDDTGRIWLAETGLRGEPLHWLAIGQRGELLARFDVPVNVSIRLIRGSTAYGVSRDENDVPRVVVYDLKPATSSPPKRS
jgi:hypothetical protein